MATLQFYPFEASYKIVGENPVIMLFGRAIDGRQVCVIDKRFRPYFWVLNKGKEEETIDQIKELRIESDERVVVARGVELKTKNFLGAEVQAIKVYAEQPNDIPALRGQINEFAECIEADIPYTRRYLIDNGIIPLTLCEVEGEFLMQRGRVMSFEAEKIKPVGELIKNIKILAFDIETHSPAGKEVLAETNSILMVGFAGENFEKVITWKRFPTKEKYIEFVDSEVELIQRFKEIIEEQGPDILAGYYSDGFDLPHIKARADKYKISLNIGLDGSVIRLSKKKTAEITGITHLDLFKFIIRIFGRTMDTTTYDLNSITKEILGEEKEEIDIVGLADAWEKSDGKLKDYCKYNLRDAVLTFNLCKKLMPNLTELIKLISLPMFELSRMSFSQLVEWYLIRRAPEFNQLVPNRPSYGEIRERMLQTYAGAFVYEPKPGLYKDIVVFDFRSLYPSIISAHNISPDTLDCYCCRDEAEFTPEEKGKKSWFCKKRKGFVSIVIEDLITRRIRVKEIIRASREDTRLLKAREQALKTIANSMYGYLGFFGARWYSIKSARSITAYGRYYIKDVIEKAKKSGFDVLYSDSLPYDRHLYVKFNDGDIRLMEIGELYDKYRNNPGISTLSFDKNKKVVFKPIARVIRHKYKGELLKMNTKYGSTIVTPQHSVYSFDYGTNKVSLVDAKNLKKGGKLISLTNPEFKVKYAKGRVFDAVELNMGSYSKELLLYSDNLKFPQKKGECPYCKKERCLSSHVNSKHPERRQYFNKKSLFSWIGGKNAKIRKIPRHWELDESLAWLLGFYCAEGSVTDVLTKTGRKCILSFGSQNKDIIEKVKSILDAKTNSSTAIIEDYDKRISKKMYYYRVQCMPIVSLFHHGFGAGKGSEAKKVPWFIFNAEASLRNAFVKGYLDGDGQAGKDKRYATHFIRFSTKSKELAMGLDFLLKSSEHSRNHFKKEIKHVSWQYRNDKPKIQTLRLQSAKESKGNFCLAEIRSISKVPSGGFVYDVEIEETHNFVDAEGMILVHNTDSIFMALGNNTKEKVDSFIIAINQELPELMELEYEGFYPSGIFVGTKETGYGAKKKYALLSAQGAIKIKGFETVRRNLSFLAKKVQEETLRIILKEDDIKKAHNYVSDIINKTRKKEIPIEEMIIQTQLQKEIGSYDSIGPHVAVALRMKMQGKPVGPGSIIRYVIVQGKERIRDRARLPEEVKGNNYDPDYYINNQIIPVVEKIFEVLGYKKEDLIKKEQSKLDSYFGG